MNFRELERRRRTLYQIHPSRRVSSLAAAARLIDRVGFCWLFAPSANVPELPSLFEAGGSSLDGISTKGCIYSALAFK